MQKEGDEAVSNCFSRKGRSDPKLYPAMECHEHLPLPSTMFRLIKALEFSEEEAAEFWIEIDAAYARDREMQETASDKVGRNDG